MADGIQITKKSIADFMTACVLEVNTYDSQKLRVSGKLKQVFFNNKLNSEKIFSAFRCDKAFASSQLKKNNPPPLPPDTMASDGTLVNPQPEEFIISKASEALLSSCVKFPLIPEQATPVPHKWVQHTVFDRPYFKPKPGSTIILIANGRDYWPLELEKSTLDAIRGWSF